MDNMEKYSRKFVWFVIAMFILRFEIGKIFDHNPSIYQIAGYACEAISFSFILSAFYVKILWRYNPIEKTPRFYKEYAGTLISSYDNKKITVTIRIKQTLFTVKVTLVSEESRSTSTVANLVNSDGEYKLIYSYLNTPNADKREISEIHHGTAIFNIDDAKSLSGNYFTDRKTNGTMSLERK